MYLDTDWNAIVYGPGNSLRPLRLQGRCLGGGYRTVDAVGIFFPLVGISLANHMHSRLTNEPCFDMPASEDAIPEWIRTRRVTWERLPSTVPDGGK